MQKIKEPRKAKIGIYTMGLQCYWAQFEGLRDRLLAYGRFIAEKVEALGAEVYFYGIVDCETEGRKAGEYFAANNVDLIFAHSGTYVTSASVLPVHQICKAMTVILNLQPTARINYEKTTTGEWLAHCGACPVPELTNAFHRAGIRFEIVNGLLGMEETPAISLTDEVTCFRPEAQAGVHVELLEMCDLNRMMESVSEEEVERKKEEISDFFQIADKESADPRNQRPTPEQMDWSARVAAAQEKLVREYDLDGLAYYYHGAPGGAYEALQSGFIVGHSLLTAKGIPCAGEGDLKACLAMKICDLLGVGGSFCEIVVTDYESGTILMGHDGPFHLAIAQGKPMLRGLGVYHGKQGSGVSVEAKVRTGDITNLGCTQTADGKLKFLITEAQSVDGPIMTIGNTQTPVRFRQSPDDYMDEWFAQAPTHHFAMSVGHNASLFEKTAKMLGIQAVVLDRRG